jgi:ubiquinone/menaquinone biosynthesis C-methylase UbiE
MWSTRGQKDFHYFEKFEASKFVEVFWGRRSRFRRWFDRYLDLTDILEIACGAGRHAAQIQNRCGSLTLVDTSPDALEISKRRFAGNPRIRILPPTDGLTLPLGDSSMSAVFSYDAMVHFEPLTIASYIKEAARVLRPGGRALLHHSAYAKNPTGKFTDNPAWRSYMPAGFVAHVATRSGLKVLDQEVFGWTVGTTRFWRRLMTMDALTVLEK